MEKHQLTKRRRVNIAVKSSKFMEEAEGCVTSLNLTFKPSTILKDANLSYNQNYEILSTKMKLRGAQISLNIK